MYMVPGQINLEEIHAAHVIGNTWRRLIHESPRLFRDFNVVDFKPAEGIIHDAISMG
jgi:hypothetical protein